MRANEFVKERVNPETVRPGFTIERQLPNGFVIRATARVPDPDDADVYFRDLQGVTINIFDPAKTDLWNKKYGIAQVKLLARQDRNTKEWALRPVSLHVDDEYRRQGFASAMYNFVRKLGNDVVPGAAQTPMGKAFWKGGAGVGKEIDFKDMPEVPPEPPKPEPVAKTPEKKPGLLQRMGSMFRKEPQVAENFADGKVKGKSRPGRVKKAGASCKGSVSSLRAKARKYGGEKGKMYHWCANMKGGKKK